VAVHRISRIFSASKSKIIGEIVRQSHVSDFMEHMLNRGRTYAIGAMRSNIHFSARFCRSVDLNESFGFLWVLQSEIESSCILLSFSPRLCLFAKLFFCHRFCKHSLVLLYSSLFLVIFFLLVFTPCMT